MRLKERIRIGIVGLGWVGQEVARAALEDPRVTLVGTVDKDPMKAGRDLGEIIGAGRLGVTIHSELEAMLQKSRPEVAVVCTTSDVEILGPTLEACVRQGAHVVTTCENLADEEMALSQLEDGFDDRARAAGVVVLATGVNPGFAMDRLPVMLAQVTRNVRRIRVSRVVDASTRRAQLQAKVGVGMTPHGFTEALQSGEIGHAGLSGSLRLIAKGLGIPLDKTSEAFSPVLAASPTTSVLGPVPSGRVRGIYQIARGYRARREVITLELTMALDEEGARDTIDIVGEPPIHFEGELPGDDCTVAAVLSAISVIVNMPPGLRNVLDVPLEQPEEPQDQSVSQVRVRGATELPSPALYEAMTERPSPPDLAKTIDHVVDNDTLSKTPSDKKAATKKKAAKKTSTKKKTTAKKKSTKKTSAKKKSTKKKSTKKKSTAKKTSAKKKTTAKKASSAKAATSASDDVE